MEPKDHHDNGHRLHFLDGCPRPRSRARYFVAPDPSHCGDNALLTPQSDGDQVALEEPCITPERHFLSPIRNVLRHRTHTPLDRGVQCQPEFLQMSVEADEEHHILFAKRPGNVPSNEPPLYALQSAGYIPASDWVQKFSKVDSEEAQALWKTSWNPKVTTKIDTDRIFFHGYSRPRSRARYFVAPDNLSHCGDSILM